MSGLARDGTVESVSRDQSFRHERGHGKKTFLSLVDHEQDKQPYPVGPYFAESVDHLLSGPDPGVVLMSLPSVYYVPRAWMYTLLPPLPPPVTRKACVLRRPLCTVSCRAYRVSSVIDRLWG